MGGYGAVRAALELGAHKALAFAPRTTLDVSARAAAGLPSSTFDTLLEGLAAFARVGCVELRGLDAVVEGLPPGQATDLELHVGSCDQGDVHEAERLKWERRQQELQESKRFALLQRRITFVTRGNETGTSIFN